MSSYFQPANITTINVANQDLLVGNASGLLSRLAVGANGSILNVSGGVIRWGNTIDTGGLTITAGALTALGYGTFGAGGQIQQNVGQKLIASASGDAVLSIYDLSQAANNRNWELQYSTGVLNIRAVNDAYSVAGNALSFSRTGTTIGAITAGGTSFVQAGTLTAGGNLSAAIQVATSGPLVYSGSGAPTINAAVKGSLYLRTDGTTNVTRMYVATDTVGTWTAVNTVA